MTGQPSQSGMNEWQLQDAKARFSELVKRAADEGPQTVTVRGERAAVVLSAAEYDRLAQPPKTLLEVLTPPPDTPDEFWDFVEQARDKTSYDHENEW